VAETFLVTLKPHSNRSENPVVHTGHETVFSLEGQYTYTIEDQTFLLELGDSLFFEVHIPLVGRTKTQRPPVPY
jgi:quercetin dioxygenase-like cupin family protein